MYQDTTALSKEEQEFISEAILVWRGYYEAGGFKTPPIPASLLEKLHTAASRPKDVVCYASIPKQEGLRPYNIVLIRQAGPAYASHEYVVTLHYTDEDGGFGHGYYTSDYNDAVMQFVDTVAQHMQATMQVTQP